MNTSGSLNIPTAVLALTSVTASEKMLLALYIAEPGAKNYRALRVVGVSPAGLKKIKRRLVSKGLLRSTADGYEIMVPGIAIVPSDVGGNLVSKWRSIENPNKVAPLPNRMSVEQILKEHNDTIQRLTAQSGGTHLQTLLSVTEDTLQRIRTDVGDGKRKDALVKDFTARCNAFFVLTYGAANLPPKRLRELDQLIAKATSEQLTRLRAGIERAQLPGGKATLLLEQMSS